MLMNVDKLNSRERKIIFVDNSKLIKKILTSYQLKIERTKLIENNKI